MITYCSKFNKRISDNHRLSFIADNIFLMEYVRKDDVIKKQIGILKMRGSRHDNRVREFCVKENGPEVIINELYKE